MPVGTLATSLTGPKTLWTTQIGALIPCAMGQEQLAAKRVIKMREKTEHVKSSWHGPGAEQVLNTW